jgi:hypothetical protein
MRSKLATLCLGLVVLAAACGGGGGDDNGTEGGSGGDNPSASESAGGPVKTPSVKAAPSGEVNRPKAGAYVYDYSSESTNAATPDSPARTSSPDAELSSKVSYDGDEMTVEEQTTEGPAVATVVRRWSDDGMVELSFKTKAGGGSAGCEFSTPLEMLRIPIKTESFGVKKFVGKGNSCDGQRTVTVGEKATTKDADGATWSVWKVVVENQVRSSVGLTTKSTVTNWFSPDLGKEIRISSVVESINSANAVQARGETTSVLKTYPA